LAAARREDDERFDALRQALDAQRFASEADAAAAKAQATQALVELQASVDVGSGAAMAGAAVEKLAVELAAVKAAVEKVSMEKVSADKLALPLGGKENQKAEAKLTKLMDSHKAATEEMRGQLSAVKQEIVKIDTLRDVLDTQRRSLAKQESSTELLFADLTARMADVQARVSTLETGHPATANAELSPHKLRQVRHESSAHSVRAKEWKRAVHSLRSLLAIRERSVGYAQQAPFAHRAGRVCMAWGPAWGAGAGGAEGGDGGDARAADGSEAGDCEARQSARRAGHAAQLTGHAGGGGGRVARPAAIHRR
jgi:chromosome segregation ATPase